MKEYSYIHNIKTKKAVIESESIPVILICSSDYRMKSLGPKPMLKIYGDITLLDYQVSVLKKIIEKPDIFLCVGNNADKILSNKPSDVRIIENQMHDCTNEVEYLRLALNAIPNTNKLICISGDIFFDMDHIKYLLKSEESSLIYDSKNKIGENAVGITVVDDRATRLSFGQYKKWAHMFSLVGDDIDTVRRLVNNKSKKRLYLFECINVLLEKKTLNAGEVGGNLFKIENSKVLKEIQNENINK